ncbi:AVAST type 1 anti-phage system protease Avs1b [Paraburkholderia bannensis]|uniref:AVAST type 1 anti-phage system protease Avs1b n=1 Tax=Paraburkholderia bannensis TaxID=765414 RepID=UPI002ABE0EA8|nr:AVAST type 1 anti-phage system protease Avs1b [Paraburkholderia bannensis]
MIEEQIRQATCQVLCSGESGTGWLISRDTILTARHCVIPALASKQPIEIKFGVGDKTQTYQATVLETSEKDDVALLRLETELTVVAIELQETAPRPGVHWFSFGFPAAKLVLGHRVEGTISQVLEGLPMGVDLDIVVSPETSLSDYEGFSGAALIVGGRCAGMLRLGVDRALGALSISAIVGFLRQHGIVEERAEGAALDQKFAERHEFATFFEAAVVQKRSGYFFLEGAPGIGKSTFCSSFQPRTAAIELLGTYSIGQRGRQTSAAMRAQPEILCDWLTTLYSNAATGKPARLSTRSYPELVSDTENVLRLMAARCAAKGTVGLIFVDGLNEAAQADGESFKRLVGLLPATLDDCLIVVLTSPSFDGVSGALGGRVTQHGRFTLPALSPDAELKYCAEALVSDSASHVLVRKICDRAKGHPLYLRYLLDLVNGGAGENVIDELPTFSGDIQDYYETIWAGFVGDSHAVHLLGLMARLRWGVSVAEFVNILDAGEQTSFVSAAVRIRHLLSNSDNTAIYHSSFADFLLEKTRSLDVAIHSRLAVYFDAHRESDYAILNLAYHGLLGDAASQAKAVRNCQQEWVDDCVNRGAEPDLLLDDINNVLSVSSQSGAAVDVIRLLLLSQRVRFRYNALFAQSAALVAGALVSLGKTTSALQHLYRDGHRIASIGDIFGLARQLISHDQLDAAWELLERVDAELYDRLFEDGQRLDEFIEAVICRTHLLILMQLTGFPPSRMDYQSFALWSADMIRVNTDDFPAEERDRPQRWIQSETFGASLCLSDNVVKFDRLPDSIRQILFDSMDVVSDMLLHYREYSLRYEIPLDAARVSGLIAEIERLMSTEVSGHGDVALSMLDTLILLGISPALVAQLGGMRSAGDDPDIPLVKPDNVTVDLDAFMEGIAGWRFKSYIDGGKVGPALISWSNSQWKAALGQIVRGLALSDGRARRATSQGIAEALADEWLEIERTFFKPMRLPLSERISWERSCAIPETIFPRLYAQLTTLCLDCYPERLGAMLAFIDEQFSEQCGMYSEGFRQTLFSVLSLLTVRELDTTVSDCALELAMRWRDYVLRNVQNRHELVPELLQMIPIFGRLGAAEEANRIYDDVLANSMGPSWYKEEQFSLMTGVLKSLPAAQDAFASAFPRIEAYLDAASGEITFQRFVRYAKDEFIGELTRRGRYGEAVRYFKRQVCGTQAELYAQANEGEMDKASPMEGMRFPGGALDEQSAISRLLEEVPESTRWHAIWALLEVYQQGDSRYVERWGSAFARLIAHHAGDTSTLEKMQRRLSSVVERLPDIGSQRALFSVLKSKLVDDRFADLLTHLGKQLVTALATGAHLDASDAMSGQKSDGPEIERAKSESDVDDDDRFMVPGLFGSRRALPNAKAALQQSQRQFARRNFGKAKDEAVRVLEILQAGQWSIWRNSGEDVRLAEEIIRGADSSAGSLVQRYAPLLQAERHTDHWVIASHLVGRMGTLLSPDDQAEVVTIAIEHIGRILGATAGTVSLANREVSGTILSADEALYETLLWALDHPAWERRDAAANAVLWLVRESDEFLCFAIAGTSFAESSSRADILCGALDILSREHPAELWDRIRHALDVEAIVRCCRHVGRFATIRRIVRRASDAGAGSAREVFDRLNAALLPAKEAAHQPSGATSDRLPAVLETDLIDDWRFLVSEGFATDGVATRVERILQDVCSPLEVGTARKLERLLAKGFGLPDSFWLTRWKSKVRYCLNVALFDVVTPETIDLVERRLRICNPESLEPSDEPRFPVASLIESLSGGGMKFNPSNDDQLFLSYQGYISDRMRTRYVELMPFLVQSGRRTVPPSLLGTFSSIELPDPGGYDPKRVCAQVQPVRAYFGSLTPPIPVPSFLERTGLSAGEFKRSYWRESLDFSGESVLQTKEGCMLSIDRDVLRLPDGYQLAWTIRVDGELAGVVENY